MSIFPTSPGSTFSGAGSTTLAWKAIGKLTSLKMLNLTENGVSDVGLAHLNRLKNLTELRLERTLVTDAGIAVLKTSLPDANAIH